MFKLSQELIVFLMAVVPLFGQNIAIPLALTYYEMHWSKAFFLSVSGNILPIYPFLMILDSLAKYLKKNPSYNKIFLWVQEYTKEKGNFVENYEIMGLMIFVAVSLPFTGVWFGCLIAFILGMNLKNAFYAMSLGSIISGIIIICVLKLGYLKAVIIAVALIGISTAALHKILIEKK